MNALYKMAIKLGPKLAANPALAIEMAPAILVVAAAAAIYEARKK